MQQSFSHCSKWKSYFTVILKNIVDHRVREKKYFEVVSWFHCELDQRVTSCFSISRGFEYWNVPRDDCCIRIDYWQIYADAHTYPMNCSNHTDRLYTNLFFSFSFWLLVSGFCLTMIVQLQIGHVLCQYQQEICSAVYSGFARQTRRFRIDIDGIPLGWRLSAGPRPIL